MWFPLSVWEHGLSSVVWDGAELYHVTKFLRFTDNEVGAVCPLRTGKWMVKSSYAAYI